MTARIGGPLRWAILGCGPATTWRVLWGKTPSKRCNSRQCPLELYAYSDVGLESLLSANIDRLSVLQSILEDESSDGVEPYLIVLRLEHLAITLLRLGRNPVYHQLPLIIEAPQLKIIRACRLQTLLAVGIVQQLNNPQDDSQSDIRVPGGCHPISTRRDGQRYTRDPRRAVQLAVQQRGGARRGMWCAGSQLICTQELRGIGAIYVAGKSREVHLRL